MIGYSNALSMIEEVAALHVIEDETVPLGAAPGRVLATDINSPEDVPAFTNSAMDGFAVQAAATRAATQTSCVRIPVRGIVAAGDLEAFRAASASSAEVAVEIMTGAPLPTNGLDSVVRIEDVRVERSGVGDAIAIHMSRPVRPGENVRVAGTDFKVGQPVVSAGTLLAPEHVMACASLGVQSIRVKKRLRVGILSTGSELVAVGEGPTQPGMIRNSTGPFLLAAAQRLGLESKYYGIIRDDPSSYRNLLEKALDDGIDVFISTGAVSMGKFDFVANVLSEMGAKIFFHKVAIRPGKPILFGQIAAGASKMAFFGVPGNPVATAVGMRFFVEPYVRAAFKLGRERPFIAHLSHEVVKPEGLRCFFKGRSGLGGEGLVVETLKGQGSYVVSSLLESSCWAVLPEGGDKITAGSPVGVYPLHNSFERGIL